MSHTDTRAQEVRRAITESAVSFLWEHAFRDLTVARLMDGTSLSRSAFYLYFKDLHHLLEALLAELEVRMHAVANPWLAGEGEPIAALRESLQGIVMVCVEHGPVFRAITDAATLDERLEGVWAEFMGSWDNAVTARIEAQQEVGLIPEFDARAMAKALNRTDTATLVAEFGSRPQGDPEAVLNTLHRIWVGALYAPVK